jgi:uncharacterized membrane protein YtjA (UPF0391 family)
MMTSFLGVHEDYSNGRAPPSTHGTSLKTKHCPSGAEIEDDMLKWAIIFAVIALVAGALGFGGIAGAAAGIAKILFFIFLVICAVFLVLGFSVAKKL